MPRSYEAKIVREGDSFIFDFPVMESLDNAHEKATQWISDNQIKFDDDFSFFIRQNEELIKVIQ